MRLTLLTRACCHLCDEMERAVRAIVTGRDVEIAVVDVDADAALEAAYGDRVPVLFAGEPRPDAELCHYRLDASRLAAAMAVSHRTGE
jgi:hypothetical protein